MDAYYNCLNCMNKKVRILTVDGKQYEGTIMDVDRNNVYLKKNGTDVYKRLPFILATGMGIKS